MIILTDRESEYALRLMELIERRGFSQLAKIEFDAGCVSQNEMYKVFQFLKQENWAFADKLIEEDAKLVAELKELAAAAKPGRQSGQRMTKSDLQRRIRNNFSTSEIRKLRLYHRPEEEVIPILEEREKERYGLLLGWIL